MRCAQHQMSRMTRRKFTMMAGATVLAGWQAAPSQAKPGSISLVLAPSNLGLRPTESGGQPGTWRAPQVLIDAGLARALDAGEIVPLERPIYEFEAQAGTRIRNGLSIRAFSLQLSEKVRDILKRHRFPLVIGGDCSILLGSLYAPRRWARTRAHRRTQRFFPSWELRHSKAPGVGGGYGPGSCEWPR